MPKGYDVGRGATDQKGNNCTSNLPKDQVATKAPHENLFAVGNKKRTLVNDTFAIIT